MKTFLLSGAGGFLGTALLRQLAGREDIRVIALTSQAEKLQAASRDAGNLVPLGRNAIFEDDFNFSAVDVLINCAFPRNTDGAQMADGLLYIQRLLSAAASGGVGGVINISSQSVYSQARPEAATEETPPDPGSIYAVGKYATELLTNSICEKLPHTNIRMASLIGPGFDQRLVNRLIKQGLETGRISVKKNKQVFGFIDVEDAARGILSLAAIPADQWEECYTLGIKTGYSLTDIASAVEEVLYRKYGVALAVDVQDGDERLNTVVNADRIARDTGFTPCISMRQSIERIAVNLKE